MRENIEPEQLRKKRGLFNVVGELSRALFGTAQDEELKAIKDVINEYRFKERRIIHVVNRMTTIVNQTREYTIRNREHIENIESYMKIFSKNMNEFGNELATTEDMTKGLLMIDILQNDLNVIQAEYNNFEKHLDVYERQKAALHVGHLTEDTLKKTKLWEILREAERIGHSHATPEWYYKHTQIETIDISDDHLIFRVFLPLYGNEEYNVYRFYSIPVYRGGITIEIEVESILGVSTKNNYIMTPESCIGRRPMICDSNISYNKRYNCERSVIAGNSLSRNECKFTVKKNTRKGTIVMRVDKNRFIVSTEGEEIYFHCRNNKINSKRLRQGVYMIHLGRRCWITGNGFRIQSIVEKLVDINMTSENVIIKEIETMNTFQTQHIKKLKNVFNNRKLEEIKGISIDNIDERTDSSENSDRLVSWLRDAVICTVVILLVIYIFKGPINLKTCVKKCKRKEIEADGNDLHTNTVPLERKKNQELELNDWKFDGGETTRVKTREV